MILKAQKTVKHVQYVYVIVMFEHIIRIVGKTNIRNLIQVIIRHLRNISFDVSTAQLPKLHIKHGK